MGHPNAWGAIVGAIGGVVATVVPLVVVWLIKRQRIVRAGGVYPLPGWRLTEQHLSQEARVLVAKVARATLRDQVQEWDEIPLGLRVAINQMIMDQLGRHMVGHCHRGDQSPRHLNNGAKTGR